MSANGTTAQYCKCQPPLVAISKISGSTKNFNRPYLACARGVCDYFKWLDAFGRDQQVIQTHKLFCPQHNCFVWLRKSKSQNNYDREYIACPASPRKEPNKPADLETCPYQFIWRSELPKEKHEALTKYSNAHVADAQLVPLYFVKNLNLDSAALEAKQATFADTMKRNSVIQLDLPQIVASHPVVYDSLIKIDGATPKSLHNRMIKM